MSFPAFKYNEIRELDLSMLNKLEVVGYGSFKGNIIEEPGKTTRKIGKYPFLFSKLTL